MNRRGFTIVELIIVITIMAILLVLAVVNLRGTQISARDDERKTDTESIALNLEIYYNNSAYSASSAIRYPSTGLIGAETTNLPDIDPRVLTTPGATSSSLVAATNAVQTVAGVTPQPTTAQYVYQPIDGTGALCVGGATQCRKFNLYYRLEANNTVYMRMSKNQ
jgi:prepilin-type N-terminal cleavage/methylation domain-containing protein